MGFFPEATRTGKRCLGFRWEDGVMTRLPTLGGTHGFATGTNNLGQTVGWAENNVHDRPASSRRSYSSARSSGAGRRPQEATAAPSPRHG